MHIFFEVELVDCAGETDRPIHQDTEGDHCALQHKLDARRDVDNIGKAIEFRDEKSSSDRFNHASDTAA